MGPTTTSHPPRAERTSSRAVLEVRTSSPAATAGGSCPTPPANPANTGSPGTRSASDAAAARISDRSRSRSATICGTAARAEISRA